MSTFTPVLEPNAASDWGTSVDTGWSGSKASRPELGRLMRETGQRKADVLSLLEAGSVRAFSSTLHEWATGTPGSRCPFYQPGIDTEESNPAPRFLWHILMAAAECFK
jgi:hypothetical protein